MNLTFTIIAAILIMALVVLALLSGYLLTGKKLRKRCGMLPKDKNKECPLCGTKKKCDDEKENK